MFGNKNCDFHLKSSPKIQNSIFFKSFVQVLDKVIYQRNLFGFSISDVPVSRYDVHEINTFFSRAFVKYIHYYYNYFFLMKRNLHVFQMLVNDMQKFFNQYIHSFFIIFYILIMDEKVLVLCEK